MLPVSVLQVTWKMALQLGNHFFHWPFQARMMCVSIQASSMMVAGPRLRISAVWAQSPSTPTTRKGRHSHGQRICMLIFSSLGGKIIYSWFSYTHFSVIYQLSFMMTFVMDNRGLLPLKVNHEPATVSLPPLGLQRRKGAMSLPQHQNPTY